jgi:hypothetical protein
MRRSRKLLRSHVVVVTLISIGVDVVRYQVDGPLSCPSDTARRALLAQATFVAAAVFAVFGAIGYVVFGLLA